MFALIPFLAFSYALTLLYLIGMLLDNSSRVRGEVAPNIVNRSFWLVLLFVTISLAIAYRQHMAWTRLASPVCLTLAAVLLFSLSSVAWAYSPDLALSRVTVAVIVGITIFLPFLQRGPEYDTIKWIFRCYAFAVVVSALFVLNQTPMLTATGAVFGYKGYFTFKGNLGQCASVAILLSLYALRLRGADRFLAPFIAGVALWLIVVSHSKGSLAFIIVAPILAAFALGLRKVSKSPLIAVLAACFACYYGASLFISDMPGKISYQLYGDSTFTGRTWIWQFADRMMLRSPWLGWGFHSFWAVGPNAPSIVEAPEWISRMNGSHSGYRDVQLEIGYIGYALFLAFLAATMHGIDKVIKRDAWRGWLLLSLAFYVMITNLLETVWLYNDPLWLLFLLVCADTLRFLGTSQRQYDSLSRRTKAGPQGHVMGTNRLSVFAPKSRSHHLR